MADSGFSRSSEDEQRLFAPDRPRRAVWPWIVLLVLVTLLVVWRLSGDGAIEADGQGPRHPAVGTRLSGIALEPLVGEAKPLSDQDLAGKVTLINFWGPWCGPCVVEFPHLVELEQHFRRQADFQFISVSSNPSPDETGLAEWTESFAQQHGADFPIYRDPHGKTMSTIARQAELGSFNFPTTLVIDREGSIRALWIGYGTGLERQFRDAVADALAAKGVAL